jgi:Ni/Fe-hydrogenase subunit HybB-like protein
MISLGLIYLYFTFAEFLTEGYVLAGNTVPLMESLLLQSYAPLFWFFVLGGGIVPILLVAIPRTRTVKGIVVAAALVVVAMWIKRFLIIVPTLRQALLPASTLSYGGSWVEFSITLAAAAAIPLALMLMFRVFPVISVHEMEEVSVKETEAELEPAKGWQIAEGEGH